MINNWYRDMNPPPSCPRPNPEGGCDCGGLNCLCTSCIAGRAALGEEGAEAAIAEAIRGKELITEQLDEVRKLIESGALRRREPLILPYDPPAVHGVTGPPVSAGGHLDMIPGPAGPFGVVRVREVRPGVWVPDGTSGHRVAVPPEPPPDPGPEPDEEQLLWASLWEPMFLSAAELDRLAPSAPAGSCSGCHLPAVPGKPMCPYCAALHEITCRKDEAARRAAASPVAAELAKRAGTCKHVAYSPDGRCRLCGVTENQVRTRARRKNSGAALLVMGTFLIYAVSLAHLPRILGFIGVCLVLRALILVVRR